MKRRVSQDLIVIIMVYKTIYRYVIFVLDFPLAIYCFHFCLPIYLAINNVFDAYNRCLDIPHRSTKTMWKYRY